MDPVVQAHLDRIDDQGYTIVEGAVDRGLIDALNDDLLRLERDLDIVPADNLFEGTHTTRIYNLLAHGLDFQRIPIHPAILPICEGVLDEGLLISSLSSIAIGPDETPQPIHADDQVIPLPKPHPPTVCNTMWALTDFTEANGATRIVPGSHTASGSPDLITQYDSIPAEMAKGSVLVWHGSLWHGGGANTTTDRRVGIAMNYCAG
ncbi:MAG: phytanoyl-CoA dioxygenase family protein, partial [Acidimicrobiales bacterium]